MIWVVVPASGLACAWAAWGLLREGPNRSRDWTWGEALFALIAVLGVAVPAIIGWSSVALDWIAGLGSVAGAWLRFGTLLGIAGFTAFVAAVGRGRVLAHWSTTRFLATALGVGAVCKLGYVLAIDVRATSDFAFMWDAAGKVLEIGWPHTDAQFRAMDLSHTSPRYEHLSVAGKLTLSRVLVYFLPLRWGFGGAKPVYELANVATTLLAAVCVFDLGRRWLGEHPARAALLVALAVPATFFTSAIPSHDIPGATLLMLSLWVLDWTRGQVPVSLPRALAGSVLLGLFLSALHLQRGLAALWHPAILVCLGLIALHSLGRGDRTRPSRSARLREGTRWVVLLLLTPCLIEGAVVGVVQRRGWTLSPEESGLVMAVHRAAHSDPRGNGTYRHFSRNYADRYGGFYQEEGLDLAGWERLGRDKLVSAWADDPWAWIPFVHRKARRLYSLTGQPGFYYEPWVQERTSRISARRRSRFLTAFNQSFVLVFLPVLAFGLLPWCRRRSVPPSLWPAVIFLALLSTALILIGETQPRYMYPIWYIGPLICATLLAGTGHESERTLTCRRLLRMAIVPCSAAVLALAFLFHTSQGYERRFMDFREWNALSATYDPPRSGFFAGLQAKQRRYRLALAHGRIPQEGDRVAVRKVVEVGDDAPRTFRMFVHSRFFEPDNAHAVEAFTVSVYVNGALVDEFPIANQRFAREVVASHIEPERGRIEFVFAVTCNKDTDRPAWRKASLVHFEHAQLFREG